ncbi:hypothetical protein BGZ51_003840 [Haplosporangium sp. Z 767]|nr:hypothetical protein BGZ51_003840 [Haplosporangium sp. Z 767]
MSRFLKDTIFAILEVFARVARYLSLWERDPGDAEEEYDWRPKDLISCSRVNSTWNSAVISIIYHTHANPGLKVLKLYGPETVALDQDEDEDEIIDHNQEHGQNAANANVNAPTNDKDGSMPHIMDVVDMQENFRNLRTLLLHDFVVDGTALYRIVKNMTLLNTLELQQCAGSLDVPVNAEELPVQNFIIMMATCIHLAVNSCHASPT